MTERVSKEKILKEIDTTGKFITKIRHKRKEDDLENQTDTEGKKILEKQRLKCLWEWRAGIERML